MKAGQWGGSALCKEDGTYEFEGVPPGEYVISAKPGFPHTGDDPDAKTVNVTAGKSVEVKVVKRED